MPSATWVQGRINRMLKHQYTWQPRFVYASDATTMSAIVDSRTVVLNTSFFGPPIWAPTSHVGIRLQWETLIGSISSMQILNSLNQTRYMCSSVDQAGDITTFDTDTPVCGLNTWALPIHVLITSLGGAQVQYALWAITSLSQDSSVDDWGNPIQTITSPPALAAVSGKPCLFKDRARVLLGPDGPIQVETNELTVPWDDPLSIGDFIGDIYDPDTGHHFIDQPIRVETVTDHAPHGALLYRIASLRYAEVA